MAPCEHASPFGIRHLLYQPPNAIKANRALAIGLATLNVRNSPTQLSAANLSFFFTDGTHKRADFFLQD
jgi:hypothetical protein